MTHREAFDKVKTHLLTQNARAFNEERYLYRAPSGLTCAVGCLIPVEEYRPEFDDGNKSLADVQAATPALQGLEIGFLSRIQRIHDNQQPEDWARELDWFEKTWLTNYPN